MKAHYSSNEQINKLREVRALKRLSSNSNIITFIEVLFDEPSGRLALVFELMEMNLFEAIKGRKKFLPEKKVKNWIFQVLKALNYMHRNGIFHRDIKPENIWVKDDNMIKLADFGSCKGIYSKPPFTEYISTRWYRAPECLLTDGYYNYKMDIWGVGSVFFEMLALFPLFPGDDEIDQVNKIHNILGSPSIEWFNKWWSHSTRTDIIYERKQGIGIGKFLTHVSNECCDVISKMLIYDPEKRYTARQALSHPYFKDWVEQENKKIVVNLGTNSNNINDSSSFIRYGGSLLEDNSFAANQKASKKDKNKENMILPNIRLYNFIAEDSENENSKQTTKVHKPLNGSNLDSWIKLPKINFKYSKDKGNYLNSNEFKNSWKHNWSNHSIGDINNSNMKTLYINNKNMQRKMQELKKNYVSPYSKKTIENNLQI